jgi:glycosyltransferase involved in cell wall biosynthesis
VRIALFDYKTIRNNPTGSCNLKYLTELCLEHEFVVFGVQFDNPNPNRIKFVRIPIPTRPLVLLFILFHLIAPLYYLMYKLKNKVKFDSIQIAESNLLFGDISYAHFCHRTYLKDHWEMENFSLRNSLRWFDHKLHSMLEPIVYKRVKAIVVPSEGLKRELVREYPFSKGKIHVISNPVEVGGFSRRSVVGESLREKLGCKKGEKLLVFIALGQFERKGLPLLMKALSKMKKIKLVVVGGSNDLITNYKGKAKEMELNSIQFVGMKKDVRPYLWASDCFILPSSYEVFPLVALESAAAGLPLISTNLNGVEEFIVNERNGMLMKRDVDSMVDILNNIECKSEQELLAMGKNAADDVRKYNTKEFVTKWKEFYFKF